MTAWISGRTAGRLAWSLAGLSVAMFVAGVALVLLTLSVEAPVTGHSSDFGASSGVGELLIFGPFLAFPVVGALVASRRPGNPIGWICLTVGLFWMLIIFGDQFTAYIVATTGSAPGPVMMDALTQGIWVPPVGLLGIYMVLLFPDGRLPSRRWRPLAWFSGAVIVAVSVGLVFSPGPLPNRGGVRNPLGIEGYPWVQTVGAFLVLLLPLCILASALSLVLRYRHSGREVRQQIKWLALAASFVGLVYLIGLLGEYLFVPEVLTSNVAPPLWASISQDMLLLSYAGIPIAIGIAVLKYRLYDIDIFINRTLVYGALTASLAAVYFGSVTATQAIFHALTGSGSQLAIVASTLVIAALFNPLRRRVQSFIDRLFYRSKYDAARTLEILSVKLREETELDRLSGELVGVVQETMQPEHVSLWLRTSSSAVKGVEADR